MNVSWSLLLVPPLPGAFGRFTTMGWTISGLARMYYFSFLQHFWSGSCPVTVFLEAPHRDEFPSKLTLETLSQTEFSFFTLYIPPHFSPSRIILQLSVANICLVVHLFTWLETPFLNSSRASALITVSLLSSYRLEMTQQSWQMTMGFIAETGWTLRSCAETIWAWCGTWNSDGWAWRAMQGRSWGSSWIS